MRLGEFSASIIVEDGPLEEYDISVDAEGSTVACYVPSEVGKSFSIDWTCWQQERKLWTCGRYLVDGFPSAESQIGPGRFGYGDTAKCPVFFTDSTTTRDLMFSSIELTDDDTQRHAPGLEKLGEISITIFQGVLVPRLSPNHPMAFPESRPVHERAKKAMVHRVGLGKERRAFARDTAVYQTTTAIRFIFKYRPLAILQAQGIAPPPTIQPAQGTARNDVIDVYDPRSYVASPRTRHARIRALEDELARLHAEHLAESPEPVKTEPDERPAKRLKRARDAPAEVIDLT